MPGILRVKKAGKRKGPVAVIDIGSNSVRLVVYDGAKRAPLPVFNEKVICGLGRGLDVDGAMSPENIDMALNCLNRFFALTDSLGVRHVQTVATAAVREAKAAMLAQGRLASVLPNALVGLSGKDAVAGRGCGMRAE